MRVTIDIEDRLREILTEAGIKAYCRPLPEKYDLPNILIQQVGGSEKTDWSNRPLMSMFEVVIDSRSLTEAQALESLNRAIAVIKCTDKIRYAAINTLGSWGRDPARPDLAMCSARLTVAADLMEV